MLTRAIVRAPAASFPRGLTGSGLGPADAALARRQHQHYCEALVLCGLELTHLDPADDFPDSTFVEDTAVIATERCAVLTRPGAPSRMGEAALIEPALRATFEQVDRIAAPGHVDGGDVCRVGDRFFIGVSGRTNEDGARQLAALLGRHGFASTLVDIRAVAGILHLKSGISWLGGDCIALIDALADIEAFGDFHAVRVHAQEEYAANCLYLDDQVVIAAGFPRFESAVRALGLPCIALDMSEFRKMDGALTCLSLRF